MEAFYLPVKPMSNTVGFCLSFEFYCLMFVVEIIINSYLLFISALAKSQNQMLRAKVNN